MQRFDAIVSSRLCNFCGQNINSFYLCLSSSTLDCACVAARIVECVGMCRAMHGKDRKLPAICRLIVETLIRSENQLPT